MDLVIKFTEHSTNPNNYATIHANLKTPYTQFSTLMIDSLTTNACFEILNKDDYIKFQETKVIDDEGEMVAVNEFTLSIKESYSDLNASSISTLLNDLLSNASSNIRTMVDNTNRLVFVNDNPFSITSYSYQMGLVLGLYDMKPSLNSTTETIESKEVQTIRCLSVGQFLSTSILYLIGSIGEKCYVNNESGRTNRRILMRINNSYSANFPVISNNAEFSTYALSNDFSDITFELVDANFKPIKLLSPLYLTGTISGDVKSETINTSILITPELLSKNNESQE